MTGSLKIDHQNHTQTTKHETTTKTRRIPPQQKPACAVYYVSCVFLTIIKPILFILCIVVVEMSVANKTQLYIIYIMRLLVIQKILNGGRSPTDRHPIATHKKTSRHFDAIFLSDTQKLFFNFCNLFNFIQTVSGQFSQIFNTFGQIGLLHCPDFLWLDS